MIEVITRIYRIGVGDSNRYAYASGYYPFGNADFLESVPAAMRERMVLSWTLHPGKPGIHVDSSGSKWPDVMSCGGFPPSFFFSRKIVESLATSGIPIRRSTLIPIGEIHGAKLRNIPPPDYFIIETEPGIAVDYEASGVILDANGEPDRSSLQQIPRPILQLDPATWSGNDVFCQINGVQTGSVLDFLCTERVKELAMKDGWSHVSFNRMRLKGIDPFTCKPYPDNS